MKEESRLPESMCQKIRDVIMYPHKHSHRKLKKNSSSVEAKERHVISDSEETGS
jgi:hypothetical protein